MHILYQQAQYGTLGVLETIPGDILSFHSTVTNPVGQDVNHVLSKLVKKYFSPIFF